MNYPHLAAHLFNAPLLIHPGKLNAIVAGLSGRFDIHLAPSAYATPAGTSERGGYRLLDNGIALLDVFGVLAHRGGISANSAYIQGYDTLARTLQSALQDPNVKGIVLNIDSPGGEVAGAFQLAGEIYAARGQKPIAAVASDMACSAAYLIASAADTISLTATGTVGSIGVVTCHADLSRALDKKGVAITYLYAGAHKVDGNPYQPLPPEVAAQIQADVDHYYGLFVGTVATYRPALTEAAVRATEAQTYIGPRAITENLADYLETPDQAIARLAARSSVKKPGLMASKAHAMPLENAATPDAPETPDVPETPATPEPAAPETPVPDALNPVTLSQMCIKGGEPDLIPLLLQTLHTPEQVQARIDQAGEIRQICALAKMPQLADGLIASGASTEQAKLVTWDALVARSEAAPIDGAAPERKTLNRAAFNNLNPQARADFIRAGGQLTD